MSASRFLVAGFRGGRLRPALRVAAVGVAAVVTVTAVGAAPAAASGANAKRSAGKAAAAKAVSARVVSRPDVVSARVSARAQGSRVEVEALRDATSTTWVNPDGTLTTEQFGGVIRYKDPANPGGGWRDVDLTMAAAADGTVGPKGQPQGLSLAGATRAAGGAVKGAAETDLAVARQGRGKRKQVRDVVLGWGGGRLGTPVLSGTTATYRNVKPGVDLVVDARRTGYETRLVINTPEALAGLRAAAGTGVVSWDIPVKTRGLTVRAERNGGVSFVDADGQVTSFVAPPVAWDNQVDPRSGDWANQSPVAMTVASKGAGKAVLRLTPDQGWLTSSARRFPVTIDPTYASGSMTTTSDTYVSSAYPTASYGASTELRVGTYNGGGDKYRSFLKFDFSRYKNLDVVSASLSLYEFYSYSCTARPFYVYSAAATDSSTTWNTQPSVGSQYGSLSVAKGYSSSCAGGRVSVPVTGLVDAWSNNAYSTGWLRLSASESDTYGWKKFYSVNSSQNPYITFTYNRKPNAAAAPTMETAYTPSYVDPRDNLAYLFTTDSTPRFYSKATDPDGSTVSVTFEVHNSTAGTSASKVSSCTSGFGASGASVYCSPTTALANNTTYYVRAAVKDDRGLWNGTWSPWTKFATAYNTPPAATVSCPGFANGTWTDTAPTADVTCSIKATGINGDLSTPGYVDLTVDGVVKPRVKITPTSDPTVVATTVSIPKTASGAHTIVATAVARTLKKAPPTTYSFGWGGASLALPAAGTASSGKVAVVAGGPPRGTAGSVTGRIQWRVAGSGNETTGWTDGPAVPVTNAAGSTTLSPTDPVSVTSSFALSTAVREAGAAADLNSRVPVLLDVQVCFSYAGVPQAQCTWSQTPRSVTRVPHAFGSGYPTADAGPGQVALFTGEFNTSATDVSVPGYSGDLSLSRTQTSFAGDGTVAGWPGDPVTGVFGPGWTASLQGPDAGAAGLQVIDNTRTDGTIVLLDEQGNPLVFQTPTRNRAYTVTQNAAGPSPYLPATADTAADASRLTITNTTATAGASMRMTLTEDDGTLTTWAPVAYSATADTDWVPVSVNEPGQVGSTSYGRDGTGRVTRIVAAVAPNGATPPAPAVSCPTSGVLVKGCRALDISYATTTTATTSAPGDYTGQVKTVTATLWDPAADGGAGAMTTTTVAAYAYDSLGRLASVSDPRTGLGTDYTWDGSSTRLASVKASGLAAYRLTYDSTPAAPRVAAVARDNPAGSGPAVTLARFNYAVPLSDPSLPQPGLPDLAATDPGDPVRLWNQNSTPVTGYAVFGPDYTGPVTGTGVDWTRADLQYADEQGYTVNTASYGAGAWQVTATDYDSKGNVVRELDAGATSAVRDANAAGAPLDAGQVDALSTQTLYNPDITDSAGTVVTEAGTLVTDTYGPARNASVNADLNGDGVTGGPGDVGPVRPHVQTSYDQGAPTTKVVNGISLNPATGQPWRLPTTITTGVAAAGATPGQPDLQTSTVTVNSYAKLDSSDSSEGDPWTLGTPSKVTTGGITTTTRYDTEGRPTQTRQPLSGGADAGTTQTIYYTAYPNDSTDPATAACGNTVEWAGLVCRTKPAAAPTADAGAAAGGAGTLPDTRTTAYNAWLQPLSVLETSGPVTRTTSTRYDAAGRPTATWTEVAGLAGSTPAPGSYTHYIPAGQTGAGLADYTGTLNPAKTDADPTARTSTSYDAWGRATTLTNDQGETTTTTYVAPGTPGAGSVASVVDAKGTTSYRYDGTDATGNAEARGLLTSQTVTRTTADGGSGDPLVFTAAYDANANLTVQKLPGQLTQTTGYNEAGDPVSLTYSGTVQPVALRTQTDPETGNQVPVTDAAGNPVYDPNGPAQPDQPWLAWTLTNDAQGRVTNELTGPAAGFDGNPGVANPADITGYDVGKAIGYDRAYTYDSAGRLTRVLDRTASAPGADPTTSPCQVRSYAFDANGRRTTLASTTHSDGNCTTTTSTDTTTSTTSTYDSSDRPTQGQNGTGTYTYDALGRQTTIPAADTPAQSADPTSTTVGDISIGYYDNDLPRSVTQTVAGQTTSTEFTLDSAGRRATATTTATTGTGTTTTSLVRHYTDNSDNPAWTVATGPTGRTTTTRYTTSIGGDLGATITDDGTAALTLANPHGDIVTTVPIPATATSTDPAAGINGWADYTEYGTPRPGSTTATTAGAIGYGWLGAKQRTTTTETAGLTLMGARLYNPTTGRFTSPDPEPGGNTTAYTYPLDPINTSDINGRWMQWKRWSTSTWGWAKRNRRELIRGAVGVGVGIIVGAAATAVCAGSLGAGCVLAVGAVWGALGNMTAQGYLSVRWRQRVTIRQSARWTAQGAIGGASAGYARRLARPAGIHRGIWRASPAKAKILMHYWAKRLVQ